MIKNKDNDLTIYIQFINLLKYTITYKWHLYSRKILSLKKDLTTF